MRLRAAAAEPRRVRLSDIPLRRHGGAAGPGGRTAARGALPCSHGCSGYAAQLCVEAVSRK